VGITIEPDGSRDTDVCACCGTASRVVWGYARRDGDPLAAYFVHWTPAHHSERDANIDLIVGEWGHGTTAQQRVGVALLYRLLGTGPAMMVIDGSSRPSLDSPLVGRPLARADVIDSPLANEVFAVADAILDQDERVEELLEPATPSPSH
jgi:hypothetical protein